MIHIVLPTVVPTTSVDGPYLKTEIEDSTLLKTIGSKKYFTPIIVGGGSTKTWSLLDRVRCTNLVAVGVHS